MITCEPLGNLKPGGSLNKPGGYMFLVMPKVPRKRFMKRILSILIMILICGSAFGEQFYSTEQILKMMIDSPTHYLVSINDSLSIEPPERVMRYDPIFYQGKLNGESVLMREDMDQRTQILYDRAETLFMDGDFEMALGFYQTIAEEHPELSLPMAYLGQTYRILGNFPAAKACLIKAVKTNFHNYMAQWFLANIYWSEGKIKQAVNHITLAKILCRNNPMIDLSLTGILQEAKRDTTDLYFEPKVNIYRTHADTVHVEMDPEWVRYAMVKAMWMFEPGFHEEEKCAPEDFNMIEASELYLAQIRPDKAREEKPFTDPILVKLEQAHRKKMDREFVYYEMWLPEHPYAALQIKKAEILAIQKYLLKVKHPRI